MRKYNTESLFVQGLADNVVEKINKFHNSRLETYTGYKIESQNIINEGSAAYATGDNYRIFITYSWEV